MIGLYMNQPSYALGRLTRHRAGEKFVGQQNRFYMGPDLRQQPRRPGLPGLADEDRSKPKSAADSFFNHPKALDGAFTGSREFASAERLAQLFQKGIVASLDAPQPATVGIFRLFQPAS